MKTRFFKMSPDTSDGTQTRQGYFLHQRHLPLPWQLADYHEATWDLGPSCTATGPHWETVPAIFSPTRNHLASPWMGSRVTPRAGEVPVVFPSGCTPWPRPKRKHIEPCGCGATRFPDLSRSPPLPHICFLPEQRRLSTDLQVSLQHGGSGTAEGTSTAPQSQHNHPLLLFSAVGDTRLQHPGHLTKPCKSGMARHGTNDKCVHNISSPGDMIYRMPSAGPKQLKNGKANWLPVRPKTLRIRSLLLPVVCLFQSTSGGNWRICSCFGSVSIHNSLTQLCWRQNISRQKLLLDSTTLTGKQKEAVSMTLFHARGTWLTFFTDLFPRIRRRGKKEVQQEENLRNTAGK